MKTISEFLGNLNPVLKLEIDFQSFFLEEVTAELEEFMRVMYLLEQFVEADSRERASGRGRPAYGERAFFRAFQAKSFFRMLTTADLISRLKSDSNLRAFCGFRKVPGRSTFSRYFGRLAEQEFQQELLRRMTAAAGEIAGRESLSIDSTAIPGREKAAESRKSGGRTRYPSRKKEKARQISRSPEKSLGMLPKKCAWGVKINSQGNRSYWRGYKLHLGVTERGIPVAMAVTGANVHDSRVAIPLMKIAERSGVGWRMTLMDSGYDCSEIREYSGRRHGTVIEPNNRGGVNKSRALTELERELYKGRSVVERSNSHLKDWLLPKAIFSKGCQKVSYELFASVLNLAAKKIILAANRPLQNVV